MSLALIFIPRLFICFSLSFWSSIGIHIPSSAKAIEEKDIKMASNKNFSLFMTNNLSVKYTRSGNYNVRLSYHVKLSLSKLD
jgi:hypothetical protein